MSQATPPSSVENPGYYTSPSGDTGSAQILSIVSLIMAALSLPCNCCCWPVSLMLAIGAVVCAVLARRESKEALPTVALVFSIIAVVLAVIVSIVSIVMLATGQTDKLMKDFEQILRDAQQGANAPILDEYEPIDVYYYDLTTGELFTADSTQIPPIDAPLGPIPNSQGFPAGVRAYVYSCTDCGDEDSHFIGWLEMYTPDVKKRLENPQDFSDDPDAVMEMDAMTMYEEGHLVRAVDKSAWVPATSEEGFLIVQSVQERCGEDAIPQPCLPE